MTTPPSCCPEYTAVTRRGLLAGAAALAGTSTVIGSAVVRASAVTPTPARAVLVVLSLRGAADGLSLVVPHGDPAYYAARPNIAVPRERLLGADAMFGLHPALAPLLPLWDSGRRPTARTSPPWRRSRTPTLARASGRAGSTG